MIDIDYLFDQVISKEKLLDVEKILSSRTKLMVAVINKESASGIIIDTKKTRAPLLSVLKAATALPVLYNRTVDVEGEAYIDAGLVIPFPIEQALLNGCTDVLTLLTRPASFCMTAPGRISRMLFDLICARGNPRLNTTFAQCDRQSSAARALALGHSTSRPNVNIATICTDEPETIQRTTRNRALLRRAAIDYERKTLRVFGAPSDEWTESF